jgi:hypothetical protein
MQYRIGVRMAQQTAIMRDFDPAQHQLTPASEAMCVKTMSYANVL